MGYNVFLSHSSSDAQKVKNLCNYFEANNLNIPSITGSFKWGNYDNDNDLDIIEAGLDYSGNIVTKLYCNKSGK